MIGARKKGSKKQCGPSVKIWAEGRKEGEVAQWRREKWNQKKDEPSKYLCGTSEGTVRGKIRKFA